MPKFCDLNFLDGPTKQCETEMSKPTVVATPSIVAVNAKHDAYPETRSEITKSRKWGPRVGIATLLKAVCAAGRMKSAALRRVLFTSYLNILHTY